MNRVFAATLCALLGLACTPGIEPGTDIPGCEGKCDGIGDFAPIAGPESLVHCELNASRDVVCDYTGVPDSFPVDVTVDVSALGQGFTDSGGRLQPGQLASIEFQEQGSVTLLGALPTDQLPVILVVSLEMRADFLVGDQNSDRSNLRSVSQAFTFDSAGDETPDLPLPLEFWPVRLFAADGGNVRSTSVGPQTIDVAPWEFFIGPSAVEHQFNLPMIQGEPQEFLLPVAPGLTTLNADGTYCGSNFSCDEAVFVFNGPGIYALSGDGAATFEPPAGTDAGPLPDSGPGIDGGLGFDGSVRIDAGNPDAGPVACGTNGQRPCADGSCAENHELDGEFCFPCGTDGEARCSSQSGCADGHYFDRSSSLCVMCGADGQVACLEPSGRHYCNDGHYQDTSTRTCAACGADGQVACLDPSGRRYCNDGHYQDTSARMCAVCGDDGQVACLDSTGRRFCNEGLYQDTSARTCAACGDDGQVACRDASGRRYCNDGHYQDTSARMCAACGDDGQVACREPSGRRYCNDGFRVSNQMCVPE